MLIVVRLPMKHLKAVHHWPASETPFEWRFACGPMVARHCVLSGLFLILSCELCKQFEPGSGNFQSAVLLFSFCCDGFCSIVIPSSMKRQNYF